MRIHEFGTSFRRVVYLAVSISIVAAILPLPARTAQAAQTIQDVATSYQPTINETIDASGFRHPGVGLTKDVLENVRAQVRAQKEPWNTYFNAMLLSGAASATPSIKNVNGADPTKPRFYGLNSQGVEGVFIQDALTAYTQAILYAVTGNETYRANALRIIRLYGQMDPSQFAYYTDAHIHTGIPLQRMVGAAEILRYTSYQTAALAWTDDDTNNFVNNFVLPTIVIDDSCNCRFMNQHLYTTIGAMSGYIFTGDRDNYNKTVEWFTVNKDAVDQGQNGAVKALFRLVTRNDDTGEAVTRGVQHVEMGRDQAHGAGDLTNTQILARFLLAQGTRVDPVDGTASTAPNAVGPYEFLDDRIFHAAELWSTFMLGHEIPWVPTASHTDPDGNPTVVYHNLSDAYRGRVGQNTWELFYYYQYARGLNMEQAAPNFTRFFSSRNGYNWDGADGGGDFWLFIPAAAASEGSKYLAKIPTDPYREAEAHFTPQDANSVVKTEADLAYVETTATEAGSKFVVYGYGYGTSSLAVKVRTNGIATMEAFGTTIQLPNTNGQWTYINYPVSMPDYWAVTIKGAGTTVDIDHVNINGSSLSRPTFTDGNTDLSVYTYAGAGLPATASFAATDSSSAATVSYQVDNLPPGASFDTTTGAFSWLPAQAGNYSFLVSARDGTSVTTRRVTIVVSTGRQAAVDAVAAPYDATKLYVTSTLATYNAAHADIESVIGSAADDVFFQKLATLRSAVAGLQLLTPVISDGSIDYTHMLVASTFGDQVPNALDNNPGSFVGFYLAQNLTYTLDFGPSFKVAATAFGLQVRTSFPERIGGVAVYGSNDNVNFTRLTPGLTTVTEDMQIEPVSDELQNQRYRFIKIAMIEPSSTLLEMGEFHIFGTRYETVNQLASVTMSSDQALKNRIVPGNTVKLNFVSTAPINNASALIQGQAATVTTADNLHWTATWVASATAPSGKVGFVLNYKTATGVDAEPTLFTTDGSGLTIADQTNLINNVTTIATVTDSYGRNAADAIATANLLFDGNISSATDYRLNGSGNGSWVEFDFRGGGSVVLSRAEVLARQDQVGRINGVVLQGSNDNTTWDTITNAAGNNADWQTLTANNATPYRYLRVINGNAWFGNMSELRLYGVVKSSAQIATASMTTAQSLSPASVLNKRIVPGNTVTLQFTAKTAINNVTATIQGQAAAVTTTDNINFTATATMPQGVAPGKVAFAVNYDLQDGSAGYPATATTDGSGAYVVDESDLIRNVSTVATLIDSTVNRSAAVTKANVDALFDSNIFSASDFRIGANNSCTGSYIVFDFKSGNQVNLTSVELLARQDQTARAKYIVFQGSNDNATWTAITGTAANTQDWQTFAVTSAAPYRYVRIYNAVAWCGNMAEVRLHGSLHAADTTAPATTATTSPAMPASGWYVGNVTVNLAAADAGFGGATTWYSVDGAARQSGNAVVLSAKGTHTLTYWSVDAAGNAEQAHALTLNIGPVDVSAGVHFTQQGATLNRATGKYVGAITVANTGGTALAGPLKLRLGNLASGLALDNATGLDGAGAPYVSLAAPLAAGASVTVNLTFTNPDRVPVTYTAQLLRGDL